MLTAHRRREQALAELGAAPQRLVMAGGGARSRLWQQIVADVFGLPVQRLAVADQSAMGAALLAGAGIGLFDPDGYLYIVDRLKEMIITGGENVYPKEVEDVLYQRPEIEECAVIGLPDPDWGERVTAFVVPRRDEKIDPSGLKAFLRDRIAVFKVPKEFRVVEELPKSPAGKIQKRELKKLYDRKGVT